MGINFIDAISQIESQHSRIAYIYMLIGHFTMVLQWAVLKILMNQHFDQNQILYIRGVMVFLFNLYLIKKYNHQIYPENKQAQKTLYIKFVIQMFSPILQFYGISLLQISDATVLSLTNPIWTQFFCWLIYGERIKSRTIIYTLVSFAGIIFICRPEFLFGSDSVDPQDSSKNHFWGCLIMISGTIVLSISQSLFKGLQGKTSNLIAMQYFYFSNLISTPVLMMHNETNDLRFYEHYHFFFFVVFIACIAFIAQMLMSRAMILESPAKLSQLAYTRIVYSFAIDIFYFKSTIHSLSIIGFFLIIFSSINIVRKK